MNYRSTRGHPDRPGFCDILLGGLAPDGGLYLPETYPVIDTATLEAWRSLSYAELAFEVLSRFITDIPPEDLRALCAKTYRPEVYAHARPGENPEDITPLRWLEPGRLGVVALSNGPTLAFKDMAMQLLGHLFEYVLEKRGQTLNILGATSGDTGSAAEYAMRGKKGVRVFMLSPHGLMSPFQRAQMYSLQDENIVNIAITGVFDDAQDVVKAVSNDADFKARYRIGAVNSINWARVAAQIVYYFKAYLSATTGPGQKVSFAVPSGNFGNICAGHIARQMGLPIDRLILATNENRVLDEFFKTGCYRPRQSAETHITSSPSMDISKASNFERFVFDLMGQNSENVAALWAKVDRGQPFDLSQTPEWATREAFGFVSGASTHADRLSTIQHAWKTWSLLIDPHTADALKVALECAPSLAPDVPILVLETALPIKFAETLHEAVGQEPPRPADLEGIEALPQRVTVMAPDVDAIKAVMAAQCPELSA
jgi:threonine synthase